MHKDHRQARAARFWKRSGILVGLAGVSVMGCTAHASPFTGIHAGAEGGVLEHHFGLNVEQDGRVIRDEYQRSWGAGGGIFGGYDVVLSPKLRIGAEAALLAGGETNRTRIVNAGEFSLKPRWGYRLTARAGFLVRDNLMIYASGGFGGHRYRVGENSAGVANTRVRGDSFIIGGGVEYRASETVGLRFDFKHLDNQTNQFFVGLPIRF
ncbi:MAG TPA: outer membrane beta-barrel protein [Sphingomonadaceae bacterium]|nr:outer membrane beta-barrel protein [Sphingomonadaceae bacterium]